MSKQKRERLTESVTSEKPSPEKSFVQVERELTEEQLEAIAAGQPSFLIPNGKRPEDV